MRNLQFLARTYSIAMMNTYTYILKAENFEAQGEVDAEDEAAAEALLRRQQAEPPRSVVIGAAFTPPVIKSIKLTLKD